MLGDGDDQQAVARVLREFNPLIGVDTTVHDLLGSPRRTG